MAEQKQKIPDFMQKYYDGSDEEGRAHLDVMAEQYERERQDFMQTTFVQQTAFQTDYARVGGQGKVIDPDEAVSHITAGYQAKAEALAKQYGYVDQGQPDAEEQNAEQGQQEQEGPQERQPNPQPSPQQEQKQETPEETANAYKEQFAQSLADMRERQAARQQKQTNTPPSTAGEGAQQGESSLPQTFAENLQSIRERQPSITPKP